MSIPLPENMNRNITNRLDGDWFNQNHTKKIEKEKIDFDAIEKKYNIKPDEEGIDSAWKQKV